MNKKTIITISRQNGSGGHEIGQRLAKELGIPFYDKELIEMAAKRSGMSQEILESIDEDATNSLLYSLSTGAFLMGNRFAPTGDVPLNDKLFFVQFDIIRQAAQDGSCVVVGRCADYVLRDNPDALHVFVHAPMEKRVERISQKYNLSPAKAKERIVRTDKRRISYYNYYSDTKWGAIQNYDLCIDSGTLGVDNAVELLKTFSQMNQKEKTAK